MSLRVVLRDYVRLSQTCSRCSYSHGDWCSAICEQGPATAPGIRRERRSAEAAVPCYLRCPVYLKRRIGSAGRVVMKVWSAISATDSPHASASLRTRWSPAAERD